MKLTIKARLGGVLCFLAIVAIAVGLGGLYGMNMANRGLKTVYEDRTVALEQVSRIESLLLQNRLALEQAIHDPSAATVRARVDLIDKNAAEISDTWKTYLATYLTPEETELAKKFGIDRGKMVQEGLFPAVAALRAGDIDKARQLQAGFQVLIPPVRDGINALRKLQVDVARQEYEQSSALYATMRSAMIVAIVLGTLLAGLAGFYLIRNIYREIGGEPDDAATIVRAIAAGDLTIAVTTSKDDRHSLLYAMRQMQQSLAQTIGEVRQSSDTIATASSQIAAGNLDLSSRTEQQAGALEETASSMEELTGTVNQNADNARQANQLAMSASEVASKGGAVVSQVIETMGAINASSSKIVDIIGVIDGIAFQTNILALNAAVEAARAGEQGRGFAVVASEVRNLAQRSAAAAKEIKALIDDSVGKVEMGARLVDQAGTTMHAIVTSIRSVTDIMGDITAASQEQTTGIEQINQAICQMDEVTQQNAALVEEAAAAAGSLEEQAGKLVQLVSVFRTSGSLAAPAVSLQEVRRRQAGLRTMPAPSGAASHPKVARTARIKQTGNGGPAADWEEI